MLQRSNIVSSERNCKFLCAAPRPTRHPRISGAPVLNPSKVVPYVWYWRDLRPQAMRAAALVGTSRLNEVLRLHNPELPQSPQAIPGANIRSSCPAIARAHRHSPWPRLIIEGEGGQW